ncbi:MAG: ATP-binding protein [Pseudomonadota bacterium]
MRLTIARKIALAVIGIVFLCVGTMAWVSSSNLQSGFVTYLNQVQGKDLDKLGDLLARRYQAEGDFEWLRRRPEALRDVLAQMTPELAPEAAPRRRPPPRRGARPEEREPPRGARDPMAFGPRLSVMDAAGDMLIGPPDVAGSLSRQVLVDGKAVATLYLRPLRQVGAAGDSAIVFLREQVRDIVIVAAVMVCISILLAFFLARHLLRPVAALRDVTARLAKGDFEARAPLLSRDELAELALHVNAMAEALEESERKRRKMLADVAHELRTPLTVLRGEIEALLDNIRKADVNALRSLHAEVLHLNKMVDDLHQLTLADAGDLHFDWDRIDVCDLLRPQVERYRARAAKSGITLKDKVYGQRLMVRADASRLTQVIVNLLENSVRYTDDGGKIAVVLALDGSHALLTIDDSAPGVPEDEHAAIFDRMYRVDAARTRERGGSGLGLAICLVLVKAHGGTIVASSSTLGGVRMVLRLPLDMSAK